jgi:phosphopantetheinyl transferase
MTSFNIFTESVVEMNSQCIANMTDIELKKPVIYLVHTDSYSSDKIGSFQKLLSSLELERAAKFRFVQDRHRYIVTHAILRIILDGYLKSAPTEIEFISNDYGKPSLPEKFKKIHFNLSHSKGLSALAFSTKAEIGIDIEKIDPEFDFDLIANAHFSDAENNFLHAENEQTRKSFYTLWTRKEALLKAVGIGIGENLGIEVFNKINLYKPEIPFPGVQDRDFYLKSFLFQKKYMISTASNNSDEFICSLVNV